MKRIADRKTRSQVNRVLKFAQGINKKANRAVSSIEGYRKVLGF